MPTYLKHAVSCEKDWQENIAGLLCPDNPLRWEALPEVIEYAKQADAEGKLISQHCIGGYMYLRSLIGPEEMCYMFIDNPSLIHKMMQRWFELADTVTSHIQACL